MMTCISCDPGINKTGLCIFKCNDKIFEIIDTKLIDNSKTKCNAHKLYKLHNTCEEIIKDINPDILAIESPVIVGMRRRGIEQPVMANAIIQKIWGGITKMDPYFVTPSKWKKMISGKGNNKKQVVHTYIKDILKINHKSEDILDAICIGYTMYMETFKR